MQPPSYGAGVDLDAWVEAHRARIVKLADGRLKLPAAMPHMEGHNTWCANVAGSTLIWPVADVAQHYLLLLLYLVQNGTGIFDDVNGRPIPGLEAYAHRLNLEVAWPMTLVEQVALTDVSVEMSTACYAGALMLQALGLGGWMYTGLNPFSVLGASGDPAVPGLGFRFDMVEGSPLPVVTGLPGVFEAHVPPHHAEHARRDRGDRRAQVRRGRAVQPRDREGPTRTIRACAAARRRSTPRRSRSRR